MMSKSSKWITGISITILCLALLALAAIWRLGLLPLLLPPPLPPQPLQASEGETVQPSGEIYLSQPTNNLSQPVNNQNDHADNSPPVSTLTPTHDTTPGGNNDATNTPATDDWVLKSQLQQEIEARYTTRMQNLAKSYEDQLNTLVNDAYNEYTADKKEGKPVSATALAGKYFTMGTDLEKQSDDQFYALLAQFKAELQSNDLPLATAIRAQQVYEYDKAVRKKDILDAAAKMI
jgi:hypothetical protein